MSSRAHASEEALAVIALRRWRSAAAGIAAEPRTVVIGGVGLGYTVRAVLDHVGAETRVVVVELVPELVAWVRGHVANLASQPLEDPRVRLQVGDVLPRIAEASGAFDVILLDVDNGPVPLVHAPNEHLYGDAGVRACHAALRGGGVLAVWSAGPDRAYAERLERAGFTAEEHTVSAARGGGLRHAVLLGVKARGARRRARS